MTTNNSIPTQPETLEPSVHALTVLVCQDCIDLKGEMCNNPQCVFCRRTMAEVQHYLDAMLLCPVVDGQRLILVGNAVTDEDTRRAAVTAPRGDVATTARNRDVAQRVVMSTEGVLGERFDIAARHELADRITAALDTATSSPTPAEQPSSLIADAIAKVREMEAENKRNYEYWKSIASEPTDMGVMKFLCWAGEDSRVIAMLESLAPPERTQVAGGQEAYCANCRSHHLLPLCAEPEHFVKKITAHPDSARRAAEEICAYFGDTELAMGGHVNANGVAAIISKHLAPADNDAESLLQHVAYSGVEFDDNQMGYVVVQIDRDVWEQIQRLVRPTTKGDP